MSFINVVDWMVSSVGKKVVHFVIKRMLQRFLKNLVPEQFTQFSLSEGFVFENLEFETNVINSVILKDVPFRLRYGKIGSLRVDWSLTTMTVSFHVSDVDVVLDYVPLSAEQQKPTPAPEAHSPKAEDVLSRSLLLGDVNKQDVDKLAHEVEGVDADAADLGEIAAEESDEEFQSARVRDMIDNAVQRMRVTVTSGVVTLRFATTPPGVSPPSFDILRFEVPWLEICDPDVVRPAAPSPSSRARATAGSQKSYAKKVFFQSFLVYIGSTKGKGEESSGDWRGYESSSVCSTPRRARQAAKSDSDGGSPAEGDDEDSSHVPEGVPDLIGMVHADDINSIEISFPAGLDVNIALESLHLVVAPKHLARLSNIMSILSTGGAEREDVEDNEKIVRRTVEEVGVEGERRSAESAEVQLGGTDQGEVAPQLSMTVYVTRLLCAVVGTDASKKDSIWHSVLETVRKSAPPTTDYLSGPTPGDKTKIDSPVDYLDQDHILIDSRQIGKAAGVIVRLKSTVKGEGISCTNVEGGLTFPVVSWRQHIDEAMPHANPENISSILSQDATFDRETGWISRKLLDFVKNDRTTQFTVLGTTTVTKQYNVALVRLETIVRQEIKIRAAPRVIVYVPLLQDMLGRAFYALLGCGAAPDEPHGSRGPLSPQGGPHAGSCVQFGGNAQSPVEAGGPRQGFPASSPSSVYFDDVFEGGEGYKSSDLITSRVRARAEVQASQHTTSGGSSSNLSSMGGIPVAPGVPHLPGLGHPAPPPLGMPTRSVTFGSRSVPSSMMMHSCIGGSDDESDEISLISTPAHTGVPWPAAPGASNGMSGACGGTGGPTVGGHPLPPIARTPSSSSAVRLYNSYHESHSEVVLLAKTVEVTVYFGSKDQADDESLMGPLLKAILNYHEDGLWLRCCLRGVFEHCDIRCTTSAYTLNGRAVDKVSAATAARPKAPAQPPATVLKVAASALKVYLTRNEVETTIIAFESPQSKPQKARKDMRPNTASVRELPPPNITITLRSGTDVGRTALLTRVSEMRSEEDEQHLRKRASEASDAHIQVEFPQARATLKKDEVLVLIYLISKASSSLSAALAPPEGSAAKTPNQMHHSTSFFGDGAFPFALLSTQAALKPWQVPNRVITLSVKCPLSIDITAPMCYPSDGKPPYTMTYPQSPPSHSYAAHIGGLEAFLVVHASSGDPFVRFLLDSETVQFLENVTGVSADTPAQPELHRRRSGRGTGGVNQSDGSSSGSGGGGGGGATPSGTQPLLRNYHSLYERSHMSVDESIMGPPPGVARKLKKGIRIFVAFSQCTPANPSYTSIRDRQDIELHVVLNRMLLSHRVSQEANNWILVLTEFFSDVQRTEEVGVADDSSDDMDPTSGDLPGDVRANRLQSTKITVEAVNLIVDYMPVGLPGRALIFSEGIGFKCLSTLLSCEFRAEVTVGASTVLLDDGHFTRDLIAYDGEASSASLFGKSLAGIVHDLELLGFIRVLETRKNSDDKDIEVVIRTLAATADCTPHLKRRGGGSGVATGSPKRSPGSGAADAPGEGGEGDGGNIRHPASDPQLKVEVEEVVSDQDKPFLVEVKGGCVRAECCADSYQLLQAVVAYYFSGAEQAKMKPVSEFYREALGLPADLTPREEPISARRSSCGETSRNARSAAAKGIKEALSQCLPDGIADGAPPPTPPMSGIRRPVNIVNDYADTKKGGGVDNFINISKQLSLNDEDDDEGLTRARMASREIRKPPHLVAESIASSIVTLTDGHHQDPEVPVATKPPPFEVTDATLSFGGQAPAEPFAPPVSSPTGGDEDSFVNGRFLQGVDRVPPQQPQAGGPSGGVGEDGPPSSRFDTDISLRFPELSDINAVANAFAAGDLDATSDLDAIMQQHPIDSPNSCPAVRDGEGPDPFEEMSLDRDDLGVQREPRPAAEEEVEEQSSRVLTKDRLALSLLFIEGYVADHKPPSSTLRTMKRKQGDPAVPEFELRISGLDVQINLYGGKDLVTSMPPDAVHQKMKSMQNREKSTVTIQRAKHLYRTTRVHGQLVTLMCNDIFLAFLKFSDAGAGDSGMLWRVRAGSRSVDVIDKLTTSSRNKILTSANSLGEHSDLIMVEVDAAVPLSRVGMPDAAKHAELSLSVNAEPLRVNVDQDALEFVAKFFAKPEQPQAPGAEAPASRQGSNLGPTGSGQLGGVEGLVEGSSVHLSLENNPDESQVYFRRVDIGNILIKVDYSAKRCSTENLMKCDPIEILNLINIEGMVIDLGRVAVEGCWSNELPVRLAEFWWSTLNVPDVLSGVPTIRAVTRLGAGAVRLVKRPYTAYQAGENPVAGLANELVRLVQSSVVEGLHLTDILAQLASGVVGAGVTALDTGEEDAFVQKPAVPQPSSALEGMKQGIETAHSDLRGGVDAFRNLPRALCDGYILLLASSICLVVLKPVRGVFRGWRSFAQGTMTSLDPQLRAEHPVLFKRPRGSPLIPTL